MPAYMTIDDNTKKILGMSADEYAKQMTADTQNYTNSLLQQYAKIAENQKNALALNKQNSINQINDNRATVEQDALNNSKQAYINKMLAQKDMKQTLSQAGLSTSGEAGTAYGNINNNYASNLANINMNKSNALRDLDNQLRNLNSQYSIQEQQLLADINAKQMDLQKYGNELAYNRYQEALNNYNNFKNYEMNVNAYNKGIDQYYNELDQQQYQREMAEKEYLEKVKQQQFQRELAEKEYQLSLQKYEDEKAQRISDTLKFLDESEKTSKETQARYQEILDRYQEAENLLNSYRNQRQNNVVQVIKQPSENEQYLSSLKNIYSNLAPEEKKESATNLLKNVSMKDAVNFNKALGFFR